MPDIISTYVTAGPTIVDSVWVLPTGTVVSQTANTYAMSNTSGPSTLLDTFVRVDGTVLSAAGGALGLFALPALPANHRVIAGETGRILGGPAHWAIRIEGIGSSVENRGEIAGGGGIDMAGTGLGSLANHGTVAGAALPGLRIAQAVSVTVLNTGTISGLSGIAVDSAAVDIRNTGTIAGNGGTAIGLANGFATLTLANLGDILGDIAVDAALSFSDSVRNDGRILGAVDLGDGADSFLGKGGLVTGPVRGGAGADLLATGAGDEALHGGNGNDTLRGGAGEDTLEGDGGNDTLLGQDGDDLLLGSAGRDRLAGGRGDDTLTGGPDGDTFVFARNGGDDLVTTFADGADRIDLTAFRLANAAEALAGAASRPGGVLLDLSAEGGGSVFLAGLALAQLTAADLIL